MTRTFRPHVRLLAAVGAVLAVSATGCSFQATRNYGPDGTSTASSVRSGVNVGIPGLRGLGGGGGAGSGGGNSPDAAGGGSSDFGGGMR